MFRHAGFFNAISAPGQQWCDSHAVGISRNDRYNFTIVAAVVAGQTSNASNRELRTSQCFLGQLVALHDLNTALDRLIGTTQVGGFIRLHHSIKNNQLTGIARGIIPLADHILTLVQRVGQGYAIRIRGHTGNQLAATIDVKDNASDGSAIKGIHLDELNPALGGFILTFYKVCALVFFVNGDFHREAIVNIVLWHNGFVHPIHTVGQHRCFSNAIDIRRDGGDHFTITVSIVRRQTTYARDSKGCTCQMISGQGILLFDADLTLNWLVGDSKLRSFIATNLGIQLENFADIADRRFILTDSVFSLRQSR